MQNEVPNFAEIALKIKKGRPRIVAVEAMKFFKDSFQKGGFTDTAFQKWKDGRSPFRGKKTLIGADNTMNLMQSIRTMEESESRVKTGTDSAYSEIHNDGGYITVTKKMKKYWWAQFYKFDKQTKKSADGKSMRITASNRKLGAKAEFCRGMAMMKTGRKIRIPQRKFIGESKTLFDTLDKWFASVVESLK